MFSTFYLLPFVHLSYSYFLITSLHDFIDLFRIFNNIYNLTKKQNTRFNLQMRTGILQNKFILIQEESSGSKTNKGDPPFLFGQNIRNGIDQVFRVE